MTWQPAQQQQPRRSHIRQGPLPQPLQNVRHVCLGFCKMNNANRKETKVDFKKPMDMSGHKEHESLSFPARPQSEAIVTYDGWPLCMRRCYAILAERHPESLQRTWMNRQMVTKSSPPASPGNDPGNNEKVQHLLSPNTSTYNKSSWHKSKKLHHRTLHRES